VTGGVNANEFGVTEDGGEKQTMDQFISSLSDFDSDVSVTYERTTAKVSKEFGDLKNFPDEVNYIDLNLRNLKRRPAENVIKVGVKKAYAQYEVFESTIDDAVQALKNFVKRETYETSNVLEQRARRLPASIEKILGLFNGRFTNESNLLVAFQYNHDVSLVYLW
jgi:hypothetical protein